MFATWPVRANHSSSEITSIPSSRAFASFEPAPGPATTRSVFFDTEPATFAPKRSACALASSRVRRSSAPVKTTVLPATGDDDSTSGIGSSVTCAQQRVDLLLIMRLGEEIVQRLGDDRAEPVDAVECARGPRVPGAASRAVVAQLLEIAEMPREPARVGLADMANAERVR